MIGTLLLFDVAPEPVHAGIGMTALVLIGIVALMISAAAVVGFVFLLRWILRAKAHHTPAGSKLQPSSPNQP